MKNFLTKNLYTNIEKYTKVKTIILLKKIIIINYHLKYIILLLCVSGMIWLTHAHAVRGAMELAAVIHSFFITHYYIHFISKRVIIKNYYLIILSYYQNQKFRQVSLFEYTIMQIYSYVVILSQLLKKLY